MLGVVAALEGAVVASGAAVVAVGVLFVEGEEFCALLPSSDSFIVSSLPVSDVSVAGAVVTVVVVDVPEPLPTMISAQVGYVWLAMSECQ